MTSPIKVTSTDVNTPAIEGNNKAGGFGIVGVSDVGKGVEGRTGSGTAVVGAAGSGTGVVGLSESFGVVGASEAGKGVEGRTNTGTGVVGTAGGGGTGVVGLSESFGVVGVSEAGKAVEGRTTTGTAIVGIASSPDGRAGVFDGNVVITRELTVAIDIRLTNGDCAEDFDVENLDDLHPGTVMVLGEDGVLHQSHRAYDQNVAGVIAGAGGFKPGILLDKQVSKNRRLPISLLGKAYCKADASYAPIEIGNMLTTCSTPGHAMKAVDPAKAFGAVIGKALRPLKEGQGLIPILITLQ